MTLPGYSAYLGAQMLANGTFATDLTGWLTPAGGWTWSDGAALLTGGGGVEPIRQDNVFVVGRKYLISFDVDADGEIGFQDNSAAIVQATASGRVSTVWVADTVNLVFKRVSGTVNGTLDNVSVYEVIE
jgi:hypothetical protein